MSYILDALRRADAERQQGGVPGLHTPASSQAALPAPPSQWLLWCGAAALLLMLAGALAWWWTRPALVVVNAVAAPSTAPSTLPSARPATAPAAVDLPPPATAAPLPIVVSAAPVPAAVPTAVPTAMPTAMPTAVPEAVRTAPASAALPAPAARTVPLQQLTSDSRRELPPLVVGGSVWSDSAASRFVILDGQVLREGETVAPGLVLERIQPKSVLLRWRDMRLEIAL